MNPYTFTNNSKNNEDLWMDQKKMDSAHDWVFQNCREKTTGHDSENRPYDGHACEWEIICKIYDFFHDDFKTINAVACNIDKKGLVFLTNQHLEVGDPIFIRVKKLFREPHNTELHEGLHAQVIWCRKIFNQKHELCYQVGVEYFS
ncbi:MAG: hypothetical protein PVJ20_11935 [Desulfobacterales bacterium]|jgi:hypothetical protein